MDKTNAMVLLERSRQDIEAPPLLNLIPVAELNNNATEDERERYRQIIFENVQTIQRNLAVYISIVHFAIDVKYIFTNIFFLIINISLQIFFLIINLNRL